MKLSDSEMQVLVDNDELAEEALKLSGFATAILHVLHKTMLYSKQINNQNQAIKRLTSENVMLKAALRSTRKEDKRMVAPRGIVARRSKRSKRKRGR